MEYFQCIQNRRVVFLAGELAYNLVVRRAAWHLGSLGLPYDTFYVIEIEAQDLDPNRDYIVVLLKK